MFERSYDYDYYCGLWLDMQRAWGTPQDVLDKYRSSSLPTEQPYGDFIVRFPDVRPNSFEEGRSPRMMLTSNIVVSRIASKEPVYELKRIPKVDAEVRKRVLAARMTDDTDGSEWFEERTKAFDDGDSVGVGVLEIGLVENRFSKQDMISAQHVPVLQHFWDWWSASPAKSNWAASVFYVDPEVAARFFGWKAIKDHIKKDENVATIGRGAEYVRIMRRFDTGYGPKGDPTFTCWVGSYKNSPLIHEYNKFERNPHAYAVNYVKSGMSRPIGRIFEMRSDAEALHSLEQTIREVAENGAPIDILYDAGLDVPDLELAQIHKQRFVRSRSPLDKNPWARIPGQEVGQDLWSLVNYYHQRFGVSGGVSDLDTASRGQGDKTATQVAEEANRLNQNMTRTVAMMLRFQRREVECARLAAKVGDRHPTEIEVFDSPVTVNQPGVPESWLSEWFEKPADVLIDQTAMTVEEDRLQSAFRLTYLDRLAELASKLDQQGMVVDRKWLLEEYIKAGGKDDPELAIMKQGNQAMPMMPPGQMPGPTGQNMPMPAA